MAGNPAEFEQLVASLLSADNDLRKHAEATFDQLKSAPSGDACAGSLLAVMRTSANVEHRSFAAIMLRKVGACRRRVLQQSTRLQPAWLRTHPQNMKTCTYNLNCSIGLRRCSPVTTLPCGASAVRACRCASPGSGTGFQRARDLYGAVAQQLVSFPGICGLPSGATAGAPAHKPSSFACRLLLVGQHQERAAGCAEG